MKRRNSSGLRQNNAASVYRGVTLTLSLFLSLRLALIIIIITT